MKVLHYQIDIQASVPKVWESIVNKKSYKVWARGFNPNATFQGSWEEGEHISFLDPGRGGSIAVVEKVDFHKKIVTRHTQLLDENLAPSKESVITQKWAGTKGIFLFNKKNNDTSLIIEMHSDSDFEGLFNGAWPIALKYLKEYVENKA